MNKKKHAKLLFFRWFCGSDPNSPEIDPVGIKDNGQIRKWILETVLHNLIFKRRQGFLKTVLTVWIIFAIY
jgi:hypothetical protein